MDKSRISLKGVDQLQLFGTHDEHLRLIEERFNSKIVVRGDDLIISGQKSEVDKIRSVFTELLFLLNRNGRLDRSDISTVIELIFMDKQKISEQDRNFNVILYGKTGLIKPKTVGQREYVLSVSENDIVFVIGPAGTGKTYIAVAIALSRLKEKVVSRIILTRPAIEAGESLGYLPGDMMEKVDPYLRPLTDALFDMIPSDKLQKYFERRIIEIVPLAYMRGRTLDNAFVILDEAQNTTPIQMKMFLTRLGVRSRAIITGDVTQIDLPANVESGLIQAQEVLRGVEGVGFVQLTGEDVVRHRLVKQIIEAYNSFDGNSKEEVNKG